ncbi:hypothetical protein [Turneriella parva]|uniref:Uncharacterized protein n=1 Tax=Turneriella parva (strain ATCC BAA-1111 / DSM 21527 / NCTC 11395 / H) TaxID=869212 RepID=I4B9D1_TURPD|nr:hypothetical protein [Turneriella parva]AFM13888.1 hypothetical protein Turpa_3249 [Turneriella parva DSM 21527]
MNDRSYIPRDADTAVPRLLIPVRVLGRGFEIPIIWNIFGSHVKRLGFTRVAFGGTCMYLSLPFFVMIHVTGLMLLIQYFLNPVYALSRRAIADYVIIDRYRIAGLTFMDKVNCAFCGYANGSVHFLNCWLDEVAAAAPRITLRQKLIALPFLLMYIPVLVIAQWVTLHIIYELLVATPLGLRNLPANAARQQLDELPAYADTHSWFMRVVRFEKHFIIRLAYALSQIEAGWCPLKHLETRPGVEYPEHHRHFYQADEVELMLATIVDHGSVLPENKI